MAFIRITVFLLFCSILFFRESDVFAEENKINHGLLALHQFSDALATVYQKVAPSVVVIDVSRHGKSTSDALPQDAETMPFSRRKQEEFRLPENTLDSEASGVILTDTGYILTNNHVIQNAQKIDVRLKSGGIFSAKVIGADDKTDIAVLKIESVGLIPAELGDSDALRVGEFVCAIGTPYNLDYTFTLGVVSALGRSDLQEGTLYEEYIQTDASINPGNSGGPLCNTDGKVVGINTLINGTNRGLAFAVPINQAKRIADQLIKQGRIIRPWLGIRIQSLSETLMREPSLKNHFEGINRGVVVETIEPNTPAFLSNLRPADVITKIDGVFVEDARALQKEILSKQVGQELELTVWRNSKTVKCNLKTAELPSDTPPISSESPTPLPFSDHKTFGIIVEDLSLDLIKRLGTQLKSGAVVSEVKENSPAERTGIQVNDIITAVGRETVRDAREFEKIMQSADKSRGIMLFIDRQGDKTYVLLKP